MTRRPTSVVGAMLCLAIVTTTSACADTSPGSSVAPVATRVVDVIVPSRFGVARDFVVQSEPAALAVHARGPGRFALVVPDVDVVIRSVGACSQAAPRDLEGPIRLLPLFAIMGERDEVGYGNAFELRAQPLCAEAEAATLSWRNTGPEIDAFESEGGVVRGRMPSFGATFGEPSAEGVVAISPRTRGTRELRLTVTLPDGTELEEPIAVHAAARASGMPSIPTNVAFYLAGDGLSVTTSPRESSPSLAFDADASAYRFVADRPGRYLFSRADGSHAFSLMAGPYATTPLDCGRSDCHAEETRLAQRSPMSTVFERLIEDDAYTPTCALGCHTLGEPGLADGGLSDTAAHLGDVLPAHGAEGAFGALPRELRRLAGVGCTACHGPGAIPEPGAGTRILRTSVCATCHDAPPRYGHVAAFEGTRMARAAEAAGVDDDPRCLSCHSTDAFVHGVAAPTPDADGAGTTDAATAARQFAREGLGCATCHAPHAESGPALLRPVPLPALLDGVPTSLTDHPSRVCAYCHAPDPDFMLPTASATALLVGRGAYGGDGTALLAAAPHAQIAGGCMACHGSAESPGVERGGRHGFGVAQGICATCHERAESRDYAAASRALAERARLLAARVGVSGRGAPATGSPADDLARARFDILLVAADGGAFAHGGPGAGEVLDAAEALLAR